MLKNSDTLILIIPEENFRDYLKSLQSGFFISSPEGISIYDFLTEICAIESNYIQENIKTVFINNSPADNLHNVFIAPGMTCALSGAMPGLVGAMMRMGGYYSALRNEISCKEGQPAEKGKETAVKLKFFNRILNDLAPVFLKKGVFLKKDDLLFFMENFIDMEMIIEAEINKKKLKKITINSIRVEQKKEIVYFRLKLEHNEKNEDFC